MTPLAAAIYDLLRQRTGLPEPRITYKQLATELRDCSDDFSHVHHRNRELYAALCEVGEECRRLKLPSLPALVVRADSGKPGDAYYEGTEGRFKGEKVEAWRRELEAVKRTRYPRR